MNRKISRRERIWLFVVSALLVVQVQTGCRRIISHEIRNSREYVLGIEAFRSSAKAPELVGDHPDAAEGDPREKVHTVGGDGSAELSLPVSGSIRKGTLYIKATEESGQWRVDELALRLDGESNWNELLGGGPGSAGNHR